MTEMYEEGFENEFFVTDGLQDETERYNKLPDGSPEKLNAAKAIEIRHKCGIVEYEASQKAIDMAERRQLERDKLEWEKEKAEAEAEDRARQAKIESRREKFRFGFAIAGFGLTLGAQILGMIFDHHPRYEDSMRNRNAEAEAKDTRRAFGSYVEKILGH